MKKPALILLCLICLCCLVSTVSCGGSSMPQNNPVNFAMRNGNFSFTGASQAFAPNKLFIGGELDIDGLGRISGTLGISNSASSCVPLGTTAMFTGSEDAQHHIMLTSAPINGQVITINTTISLDGNFFTQSSYSVTGGCLAGDHGSITAQHLLSGAYLGSVLINGTPISVNVDFLLPGTPDAAGVFPLTAIGNFGNTNACGGFNTLSAEGGSQNILAVNFALAAGASPVVSFAGSTIDSSSKKLTGTISISGGPCDQMSGQTTLNAFVPVTDAI
jgi:hypothetical protein